MPAEDYAGFGWLFSVWGDALLTLLIVAEPVMQSINANTAALITSFTILWLIMVLLRSADVGLIEGATGGALIFAWIIFGMQPAEFSAPGRAPIQMLEIQAKPLTLVLNIHGIFSSGLNRVMSEHTGTAGTILPAQSAVDDAIERSASFYGDSDLARLIRDYNEHCAPSRTSNAGPEHAATMEAYHAIGLLGGGGLGIPEEAITRVAQIKSVASGFWDVWGSGYDGDWLEGFMNRMTLSPLSDAISSANDLASIKSRREAGLKLLEEAGQGFGGSAAYVLPTQSYWEAQFSGKKDATPSYLAVADGPPGAKTNVSHSDPNRPSISFTPRSCVEAYQVAQHAAEQAYKALEATGGKASGGQSVSADSGFISSTASWQRFLSRSFSQTGEVSGGNAGTAAGVMAAFQMLKNWTSWLELQVLLPFYVMGLAGLSWLVILSAPFALLLISVRGMEVLISWFSLLMFPLLSLIFAHAISVAASIALAGISISQAAAASGWTGTGADYDGLRGALGALSSVLLIVTTWIAGHLTGVSVSGLAGSARGGVSTTTDAAAVVAKVAGTFALIGRLGQMGGAAKTAGGRGQSGSGESGNSGGSSRAIPRPPLASSPGTGTSNSSGTRSAAKAMGINLVPARAVRVGTVQPADNRKNKNVE
ncbi:hypothetical protein [Pseudomonas sp.]|uniref:hypothetical protein n=1 Tax=Pseudomonas sp. TaxID=306 RepID=UPI002C8177C7|nr:hypothetical protein [Pseudomonas sp.]HUE91859.1 hypothetical protein [Pseudomonas sp.]